MGRVGKYAVMVPAGPDGSRAEGRDVVVSSVVTVLTLSWALRLMSEGGAVALGAAPKAHPMGVFFELEGLVCRRVEMLLIGNLFATDQIRLQLVFTK